MYSFKKILIEQLQNVRIILGVWEYFGEQSKQHPTAFPLWGLTSSRKDGE